jgi:hypothetical protein
MHQLKDLAYARSGDKGDVSNIGVIAHSLEAYDILREYLTPERIKAHFGTLVKGDVEVYEMPNIHVLQVVMRRALEGGATRNLRFDQTTAVVIWQCPARQCNRTVASRYRRRDRR